MRMPFAKNSVINQPFWLDSKERTKAGYGGMGLIYQFLEHGVRRITSSKLSLTTHAVGRQPG